MAVRRGWRNAEDGRRLVTCQSCEESQFDKLAFEGILQSELGKGFIERQEVVVGFRYGEKIRRKVYSIEIAAMHLAQLAASAIDENTAHRLGRRSEEMPATIEVLIADETQVGLITSAVAFNVWPGFSCAIFWVAIRRKSS